MSGQPSDDELRQMLESRASRLSPDADREAMAGLRAAMRGTPDARGGFAVLPVAISGRGARLPGSIAAVGLVAVLVVAVVGGRLTTPQDGAASGASSNHVPESIPTLAVAGPDGAIPPEALPRAWTGADLGRAIADRSVVGQVIVVNGPLDMYDCSPGGSCRVDIAGLSGVGVSFLYPPRGTVDLIGPGSRTAFRVRDDGALDYMGELDADATQPLDVDGLALADTTFGRGQFVGGWLVRRVTNDVGPACPAASLPAPSCEPDAPAWLLSGTAPGVDAYVDIRGSIPVTVGDGFVQGSRPAGAESTFLVSPWGNGWQVDGIVAATLSQGDEASASVPPSSAPSTSSSPSTAAPAISLPVLGVKLTGDELRSRLADGSLDGRLVVIDSELWLDQRACGLRLECVVPTVRGLDGVQIDTDMEGQLALLRDLPPPGPFVFMAHDGILRYLGAQPPDVDRPITVNQLLDTRIPSLIDPSSPVHLLTDGLELVSGWLVVGGTGECRLQAGGTCPGPGPWLTDDRPLDDGTLISDQGTAVSLMADPPLERVDRVVTEGSFLVRDRSRSPAWVDTSAPCDASANVVCSGGQPAIEIVAILGPDSPLRKPLP